MSETSTGTLGKLVSLLDLICLAEQPLRFVDVVKASAQPRGTVHRQLAHLMAEGLIEQNADQTYVPGLTLLRFASKAWARNDLRSVSAPFLQSLHVKTGEAVHLAVLRGAEVIYLDKIDAKQTVRMHSQVGNSSPAYCTGVGKAALSCLAPENLRQIVETMQFHRFTPHTIVTAEALVAEIISIRQEGVAFDREEHEEGIRCIAAPIGSVSSGLIGAISITAPAYRASEANLQHWKNDIISISSCIKSELSIQLSPQRNL